MTTKQQLLQALDQRIEKLQQLREFTASENFGDASSASEHKHARNGNGSRQTHDSGNGISRKMQIHAWLKKNAPASRVEIIEATGVAAGTVSAYLSTEKNLFESRDGKWYARG